jgi:N-acetylneuraminic acid mutarotase
VYGTLGTPAVGDIPGGRWPNQGWIDSIGHLWLFGGWGWDANGIQGDLNDLWEFNPSTTEWAWISGSSTIQCANGPCGVPGVYGTLGTPAAGNVPGSRWSATSWADSSGHFWLFGGFGFFDTVGNTGDLNDLWKFDPSTNEWTWMGGTNTISCKTNAANNYVCGQPGVYGTLGTFAAGNIPGGRQNASSWTDYSGHFWLFGGEGIDAAGNWGELNDLWKFDPSTNEWAWMGGSSTLITFINGLGQTLYPGQPGVYGTLGTPAVGNAPGGRFTASSWTDSSGNLWLFGGVGFDANGKNAYLNDLWEFNPSTKEWAWMGGSSAVGSNYAQPGMYGTLGTPAAGNVPGGRQQSTNWTDSNGHLWLFGGVGYDSNGKSGYLNDFWEFNPSTNEWAWMGGSSTVGSSNAQPGVYGSLGAPAAGNIPGGRFNAVGWTDSSGHLWLFGGDGSDVNGNSGLLNDLWRYQP